MLDLQAVQGLSRAIEMKSALIEANHRVSPKQFLEPRTAASMAGIHDQALMSKLYLPVYEHDGSIFGKKHISEDRHAAWVSGDVTEGSLIEFDKPGESSSYGIVIEPPAFSVEKGVYIRSLTKEQANQLKVENPSIAHHQIKSEHIKPIGMFSKKFDKLPLFLPINNPIQRLLWQVMKNMSDLAKSKKYLWGDILLWGYIVVVVISLVIILVISR